METVKVTALKGTQCPMEGQPRAFITDSKVVEVPASAYYLRLIQDGSLVIATSKSKVES